MNNLMIVQAVLNVLLIGGLWYLLSCHVNLKLLVRDMGRTDMVNIRLLKSVNRTLASRVTGLESDRDKMSKIFDYIYIIQNDATEVSRELVTSINDTRQFLDEQVTAADKRLKKLERKKRK